MGAAERLPDVYTFPDLQQMCRPGHKPRRATVEAWARAQRIPYRYDGHGGIWTTRDALNTALGLRKPATNDEPYDPEDF
ncbi:hypothetical protein [Stenotrophomonas muris]|uniref:hypothetical protein n=1 Tax=Stenotrophomonas muris TaxID=2963283 RepID=UPI0039C6980B